MHIIDLFPPSFERGSLPRVGDGSSRQNRLKRQRQVPGGAGDNDDSMRG
jgi:hypothetical protein